MGFAAHPAGLDHEVARARFREAMPDWESVPLADLCGTSSPDMFGRIRVPPMLADLGPILERWRPGLLIHDSAEMAGAIAAEVAGIPHVEHSFGLLRPLAIRRAASDASRRSARLPASATRASAGSAERRISISARPGSSSRRSPSVPSVIRLRLLEIEEPPDPAFEAWLADRDGRPLVYLTLGTVFNDVDRLRSIVDAIDELDVDIVVTLGPGTDPSIVGARPEHVHVASFIPQPQVLRQEPGHDQPLRLGAMLGAIAASVPVLAVPQGADQFMNAGRIVEAGLGLRILPDELAPGRPPDATFGGARRRTVRGDAPRVLRTDLESMPPPSDGGRQPVRLAG